MDTAEFYDVLSPVYHLIYPDWEASSGRQGQSLSHVIRSEGGEHFRTVLDAACGIGTQSLSLAGLGFTVTASDLSAAAVERTQREAAARGLPLATGVADMRRLFEHYGCTFDVVLACDNAVPHLLSDEEISRAFEQFYRCTTPGGLCLISVRDYAAMEIGGTQLHPHGAREVEGTRYLLFQVWRWEPPLYETTFYVVSHASGDEPNTTAVSATYYAVPISTLTRLLIEAGFTGVRRLDGVLHQPLLVAHKPLA